MDRFAKWTGFSVDIEACGPIPGDFSMIEIGIIRIDADLDTSYWSTIKMLNENYIESAIKSIGATYEKIKNYTKSPEEVMKETFEFVQMNTIPGTRPMFFSDNNGFDYMFYHWYAIHFMNQDPFGHTSRNISDLYRGLKGNVKSNFKKLRMTKHTHNALDDATGNAEAVVIMAEKHGLGGLKIEL